LTSLGLGAGYHCSHPRSFPALPAAILANVLGDLWSWIAEVVGRIGDISAYWLVAALALKTAESAFIGLSWRNILRATYPTSNLSFKIAWGASQGGTAINAVVPAQAGTVVMIGIFRPSISGSSVPGLTSATVRALFFAAASVVTVIVVAISSRTRSRKARRLTRSATFSPLTVFLVAASHTLSQLFAITPGGVGQSQALDPRDPATLWADREHRCVLGHPGLRDHRLERRPRHRGHAWAFGYTQTRALLWKSGRAHAMSEP
jgi:hypothetical protein